MRRIGRSYASSMFLAIFLLGMLASLPQPADASQILTYQVSASSDDATKYTTNQFSLTRTSLDVGSSAPQYQDNGMRFLNVSLDSTYVIMYAKLKFKAFATASTSVTAKIKGEDNVSPITFSTLADFNGRTRTPSLLDISWSHGSWTLNNWYEIDITSLFNYLLNNASWVSGSNMTLFWTWDTGTGLRRAYSFNSGTGSNAPILEIKYAELFYLTVYTNTPLSASDNGIVDYMHSSQVFNETQIGLYDTGQASQLSSIHFYFALNTTLIFQNYTVIGDTTYLDNPLVWTMPENFGNATIWAYSTTTPIMPPTFDAKSALGGFLLLGLPLFTIALALRKRDLDQAEKESETQAIIEAEINKEEEAEET